MATFSCPTFQYLHLPHSNIYWNMGHSCPHANTYCPRTIPWHIIPMKTSIISLRYQGPHFRQVYLLINPMVHFHISPLPHITSQDRKGMPSSTLLRVSYPYYNIPYFVYDGSNSPPLVVIVSHNPLRVFSLPNICYNIALISFLLYHLCILCPYF